ncbi:SPOR domain-containing protein [Colwelliaceae bacterium 6441]
MKNLFIPLSLTLLLSTFTFAEETHKVGVGLNYQLDQDSSPGTHLFYQWQFAESFEFESRYFDNNQIKLQTNDTDIFANYDQFSIGANFIKQYNRDLSIKAGTGLGFVTSSSNELVVEKQSISPYFMLSATYKFSKNVAIEFGQFSHFNSQLLDTNHSLFLSFSYHFGQSFIDFQAPAPKPALIISNQNTQAKPIVEQASTTKTTTHPVNNINKQHKTPEWFVQLGAFINVNNAQKTINQLQKTYPQINFSLINYNNYYRIITGGFASKQRADDYAQLIKTQDNLTGYVLKITLSAN